MIYSPHAYPFLSEEFEIVLYPPVFPSNLNAALKVFD